MEFKTMALVPCPECHKEVSTKALACPQCGLPFPGKLGLSTNSHSHKLTACPDCGSQVSSQALSCHHCGLVLTEKQTHQVTNENATEETWLCPYCGSSCTREVKRRENAIAASQESIVTIQPPQELQIATKMGKDYHDTDIESILEDIRSSSPLWQDSSASEDVPSSKYPRGRSPLWQDSSARKDVSSPRYPRSRNNSLIVGLIIFVLVAASIVLGVLWQLEGVNPLEALVYGRR
jgi:ssDNA-binding Zn-finger/Zn-ribbon topoisomerase 1